MPDEPAPPASAHPNPAHPAPAQSQPAQSQPAQSQPAEPHSAQSQPAQAQPAETPTAQEQTAQEQTAQEQTAEVEPVRYVSEDEDSGRWTGFPFRAADIVISTRSKSGTTWMQMICALLVFQRPAPPAPLAQLSPWLDHLVTPRDEVFARLGAQQHRRFIKTHTPLDGVPVDPRATYIVVARHPLDMAVSLYHQGDNLNRARIRELLGAPEPTGPEPPRRSLHDWLVDWTASTADPQAEMDSLPGVLWHLADAWARRDQPHVLLVHYQDLVDDLPGEMRRIADRLGIAVPDEVWPELVRAATFEQMRGDAQRLVPNPNGILLDSSAFFRRGSSGAGREVLDPDEFARYQARTAELAPADLLAWLHRGA